MQFEIAVDDGAGGQTWVKLKAKVMPTPSGSYWTIAPPEDGWPDGEVRLRVVVDDPAVAKLREQLAQAVRHAQDAGDRRESSDVCDEAEAEEERLRAELAAAEAIQRGATPGMHISPSGEVIVLAPVSSEG